MNRWIPFLVLIFLFNIPTFVKTQNQQNSLQKEYLLAIQKPTEYTSKIKLIYQNPQTQAKLLEMMASKSIQVSDVQIQLIKDLTGIEEILIKSPFEQPIQDVNSPIYLKTFQPDTKQIQFALGQYEKVLAEMKNKKEILDTLDPELYQTLLELVKSSQIWLKLLQKMSW